MLIQSQIQTLRQELIPAQIQSLEILQATIQELEQKINEVMEHNPTLEQVGTGAERLAGDPAEGDESGLAAPASPPELQDFSTGAGTGVDAGDHGDLPATGGGEGGGDDWLDGEEFGGGGNEALDRFAESWRDYLPGESTGHAQPSEEEEERRQFRFDSLTAPVSLQDQLLEQLRQQDLPPALARIGEEIIGSIDESGYLRTHLADIAMASNADMEDVKKVLDVIHGFDPPGIGARDVRECLLLQLERQGRKNSLVWEAVAKHLEALGRNQIPQVARELGVSPNRVYELLAEIRTLRPYPVTQSGGRASGLADAGTFIVPEIKVFRNEKGEWTVESNREFRPRFRLSPYYLRLAHDAGTAAEVRAFLRQKLAESKLLLRALDNRQTTLERIAWVLLRVQRDFFENGPGFFHPLTLSQVAQELSLHETTIGRATAGKYIDTPHGIFPFKQFFSSGGVAMADGAKMSDQAVKQRLLDLIREEDPAHPLTDDQLVQRLAAAGVPIARRTVAKYREGLNIQASHLRKNFR